MGSVPSVSSFKSFLVSYRYEGAEWNVELPAQSWEDARRRVSALSLARCEGEVIARLPKLLADSFLMRDVLSRLCT